MWIFFTINITESHDLRLVKSEDGEWEILRNFREGGPTVSCKWIFYLWRVSTPNPHVVQEPIVCVCVCVYTYMYVFMFFKIGIGSLRVIEVGESQSGVCKQENQESQWYNLVSAWRLENEKLWCLRTGKEECSSPRTGNEFILCFPFCSICAPVDGWGGFLLSVFWIKC